jgi:hypothetical protein
LNDLLEGVLDDVLPTLPAPRRRALEIALLIAEADENGSVDPRALALATRDVLNQLGKRGPILVAIDDVQWVDDSSAAALGFVLRRLAETNVIMLLARRVADGAPPPSPIEQAFDAESVRRLEVEPLSVGALHTLLSTRLGRPFARQTLLRIHEQSGGNPFFAIELARVLDPDLDPAQPLVVPDTLEGLLRGRITGLPEQTREALAFAAALGNPSESLLLRVGVGAEALDPAAAAHVVERADGAIRFTHPLLSSVLYGDLGDARPDIHGRIADVVDDPVARARHLALSTIEPDADVAAAVERASTLAADRGASAVAAELAEQALRLTPEEPRDHRQRRVLAAARAHHAAGEWTRARALATGLLAEDIGPLHADVVVLLAELEGLDRSAELLEEALLEATLSPERRAEIHTRLAWARRFTNGSEHARLASELAEGLGDDVLGARARAVGVVLSWFAGESEAPSDLPVLVHAFAAAVGGGQLVQEATLALVNTFAASSRRSVARSVLESELLEHESRDEPRSAQARSGASPGSSSGPVGGESPPSTPIAPTTS